MNLFDQSFSRRQLIHHGLAGGVATATAALFGNSQGSKPDYKGATATGVKMASRQSIEQYPVGVEIGESHVCVAVGERLQDGSIELRSVSHRPNANPENFGTNDPWVSSAVACLGETLVEAEKSTGVMIKKVALAITSEQLRQKPCWYFSQHWIKAMLEQDRKERPSLSLGLDNYRSFERHREKRWRARGWTETERRWRRFHHSGSNCEHPCFICSADGVIDLHRLEDCLQLEQGNIVADLDWWFGWVKSGCSEHGVNIGRLVHSGVACAESVLTAAHKKRGALVLQVEEESVSFALYGGGRLLWSDCLRATSYLCRGLFDFPLRDQPTPDWHPTMMEDIRNRCSIGIPADATFHVTGSWAAEQRMLEMAETIFNRSVFCARRYEGVSGRPEWLSDPRYACVIGLLRFA